MLSCETNRCKITSHRQDLEAVCGETNHSRYLLPSLLLYEKIADRTHVDMHFFKEYYVNFLHFYLLKMWVICAIHHTKGSYWF